MLNSQLDPRRGKVVQDLARQLLPLMPPNEEPAQHAGMPDEALLVELEREAEKVRHRIAASATGSGNGKLKVIPTEVP